jgi:hypothetical protein
MSVSCSARKEASYHISNWLDFELNHANIAGDIQFGYDDVDYMFGHTDEASPLWGGRLKQSNISKIDLYWLYDKGIGFKLPLTSKTITDEQYKQTKNVLKNHHREGNAVLTATDKLAERIKQDFPKYKVEASCIQAITDNDKLQKSIVTGLYDTIVLPIHSNDDSEFLESIQNKKQIRLFLNVDCSYTCPKKLCYGTIAQINGGKTEPYKQDGYSSMKCSYYDMKMPRTFYNDDIEWSDFYFDKPKFDDIGFNKYKILAADPSDQRTIIMYKDTSLF